MPERLGRSDDRSKELPRVIRPEAETVACLSNGFVVADRVGQAPRGSHHGDRAVTERDQLREPARLESRRHPQHVGARIDSLRKRGVEANRDRNLPRPLARPPAEHVLVAPVARADHGNL